MGGRSTLVPYLFFFIVPLSVGTGLLSSARRGELDLFFGAGGTRAHLWWVAMLRMWLIPVALSLALLLLSAPLIKGQPITESAIRLTAALLFTGGLCFAAGLIEPRYIVGVLWLLARLIFVLAPAGLGVVMRLSRGIDVPGHSALAMMTILAPETLLESHLPIVYALVHAFVGVGAFALSFVWFRRADFGGRA
ncbi:MAG: hypothetical protein ABI837_05110 [Acidobacteriota bacterium]